MNLSKLQKVDLRNVWKHEALDFTQWLAKSENLAELSDEIGIDLSLIATEASVGKFNVDIYAEESMTGRKVVIENQLEATDHDHLGKIITYASGLDAEIVIWIVKSPREEHRQAIEWLNDNTVSKINFFLIQMEVWQIADSPFAPNFNLIVKPNDWSKALKASTGSNTELSDLKLLQHEFWNTFKEFAAEKYPSIKLRKTYPQHWYDISVGSSQAHISLTVNSQTNQLGCDLYISDSKELFHHLYAMKEQIEEELGQKLDWDEIPNKKASRIKSYFDGDFTDQAKWPEQHAWLLGQLLKFQKVFAPKLNA
jgi:hypothetical protein